MSTDLIRRGHTKITKVFLLIVGPAFILLGITMPFQQGSLSPFMVGAMVIAILVGAMAVVSAGRYNIAVNKESVRRTEIFTREIVLSHVTELYFGPDFLDLYAGSRLKHIRISSSIQNRDEIIRLVASLIPNKIDVKVRGNKQAIRKFWTGAPVL